MLILPAIDLRGGQCVRLTHGDYAQENVYDADPASVARAFEIQGAQYLHVVDLDGAKRGAPENLESLRRIREAISIPIEFGGGIRSLETARQVLELGANRVIVGTKLVQDEQLSWSLFEALGEKVVAGIDAREGKVAIAGWMETAHVDAVELARRLQAKGACRFIVTDIARDGALTGPNITFLNEFLDALEVPVIASGGVSSLEDLRSLSALESPDFEGVIVGKALYEERFTLKQALALN